jgi:hypothetical protein
VPTPGPTLGDALLELIKIHEMINAQAHDPFCLSKFSDLDGATVKGHFAVNDSSLLVRLSPLDDAEKIVVPRCLTNCVMCHAHVSPLAGHPGGARMYGNLRESFYWVLWPNKCISLSQISRCAPRVVRNVCTGRTLSKAFLCWHMFA